MSGSQEIKTPPTPPDKPLDCPTCGDSVRWKSSTDYHHPLIWVSKGGSSSAEDGEWGLAWCDSCDGPVEIPHE